MRKKEKEREERLRFRLKTVITEGTEGEGAVGDKVGGWRRLRN